MVRPHSRSPYPAPIAPHPSVSHRSPSIAVFPSSYRSDTVTESTEVKVDEQVNLSTSRVGREGHETRYSSSQASVPRRNRRYEEDVRIYEEDKYRPGRREETIRIHEEDRYAPASALRDTRVEIERERYVSSLFLFVTGHMPCMPCIHTSYPRLITVHTGGQCITSMLPCQHAL